MIHQQSGGRARLLGHDLKSFRLKIAIKAFLSCDMGS